MITEIRKRDGRVEPFDASKIANAITKAMVSVDEVDGDVALRVTSKSQILTSLALLMLSRFRIWLRMA